MRRSLATLAAIVTGLVSLTALTGWGLGMAALTTLMPGWPSMVPATAMAILLGSITLLLLSSAGTQAPGRHGLIALASLGAILTLLPGALRLTEIAMGADWRVSFLGWHGDRPGSMSPATALECVMLGAALLLTAQRRWPRVAQLLATAILAIAWLGLSRFAYGGEPLMGISAMAMHTALAFAVFALGLLLVSEPVGLVGLLASSDGSGSSVRWLLPLAVVLPPVLAWIPLAAAHGGWLGREAALALFALTMAVIFGLLVCLHALRLARLNRQRQHALEALSLSEERTRLIVEGALDAVVTIDQHGIITGWNIHAELLFGWARGEALGQTLDATIIPPSHAAGHRHGLQRYVQTGVSTVLNRRVELAARRRNGTEFPVEIAITPIQTSAGLGFSAFVRDITERRSALAALHESELRFRTLAESLPHLVWTCRPDGWCDYLSRQWVEYTGQPEAEQLGYGWAEHLHPEDRERARAEWASATARGTYLDIEFRIRRHDGAYRWFHTRAVPLRDLAGNIAKWFGSNTDIEDYMLARRRLHEQLARLQLLDQSTRAIGERQDLKSIFESVLDSLEKGLAVDFGCFCTYDAAERALRVFSIGAASRNLTATLDLREGTRIPVDANGLARGVAGLLVHEPDLATATAEFPRRLRAAGLGALVLAPITVEDKVFGFLVAARRAPESFGSGDCEFLRQLCTHVGLAAQQAELFGSLQAAYEDLRRTQRAVLQQERLRAIGQMASGIAHDINNALSPAALYLQSMLERESGLPEALRGRLTVVEQAIGSVAQTIGRMREFYRERDPQDTDEVVNPNEEIRRAVELTRARWHDMPMQRGIVVEMALDLAPEVPQVAASSSELRDAVTNLILNSVDAMPKGGTLGIRTTVQPATGMGTAAELAISVTDTGVGMDAETRNRCLDPFFTTKGERGTGLGLAMVYGMAQRHNGRLEIDSEPGRGTTMRLVLPATQPAVAPLAASAPSPVTGAALNLLLVDDDPVLLASLRAVLQEDGHRVTTADGGQAGIDALQAAQSRGEFYSLVVTDLGMPHVDGRKVAAAAKSLPHATPVLLLTGWGQRLVAEADIPAHVDKVLSKPPRLAELRAALRELTG